MSTTGNGDFGYYIKRGRAYIIVLSTPSKDESDSSISGSEEDDDQIDGMDEEEFSDAQIPSEDVVATVGVDATEVASTAATSVLRGGNEVGTSESVARDLREEEPKADHKTWQEKSVADIFAAAIAAPNANHPPPCVGRGSLVLEDVLFFVSLMF